MFTDRPSWPDDWRSRLPPSASTVVVRPVPAAEAEGAVADPLSPAFTGPLQWDRAGNQDRQQGPTWNRALLGVVYGGGGDASAPESGGRGPSWW